MSILENVSLKSYSYYQTGGQCNVLYLPESKEELVDCLRHYQQNPLPYFILGAGSNSLVLDQNFQGAVFHLRELNHILKNKDIVTCGAGVENNSLASFAKDHGLSGVEWINGLPGHVGGTVRMNARCYGGEISQIAKSVYTIDMQGNFKEYGSEAFRGYKDTLLMDNHEIVWQVDFQLEQGKDVDLELMDNCFQDRQSKGQYDFPSCGCVFKNNYKVGRSSGSLLEEAGAKDLSTGGAKVSPHHANFVYNDHATSDEIISLTLQMRELVWNKFQIWLEYEMEILGTLPVDLAKKINEFRQSVI